MPLDVTPVVLKFGGSSVGSPERFRTIVQVIDTYQKSNRSVAVVISALGGVTDLLVEGLEGNSYGMDCKALTSCMFVRHRLHAAAVLSLRSQRIYEVHLREHLAELEELLNERDEFNYAARRDAVLSIGERLAMHLLALALTDVGIKSCPKDAAQLVRTDNRFGEAKVDLSTTFMQIQRWFTRLPEHAVPVITGFVGSTKAGEITTLGRGGSDYSASLVATALQAERLERWTDVDGVYTSDPNIDPTAKKLEQIVMSDALAWNRAGKMGIHRKALDPLLQASIPMYVRSIDVPEDPGTAILPKCHHLALAC